MTRLRKIVMVVPVRQTIFLNNREEAKRYNIMHPAHKGKRKNV